MPRIAPKTASTAASDVARARARVARQEQRTAETLTAAKADGVVTKAEQKGITTAKNRLGLAKKNLTLQVAEQTLRQTRRDAFENGSASKAEKAEITRATHKVERLTIDRRELRTHLLERLGKIGKGSPTDLVISSFNITGSSHTGPGSSHPNLESGVKRVRYAAEMIQKNKVDVVGFQELQPDQLKEFQKVTKNEFGVYPGFELGRRESVNSIVWRKEDWSLVKADSIQIPYFNGQKRPMPVVLLRNKKTGQKAYFTNFHNPADTKRFKNQERFRDAATKLQVDLVNRLIKKTGLAVFLTGDMNENQEYHSKMTRGTELESAHKGINGARENNTGIDWIFGSKNVEFTDYDKNRSKLVRKTTNHPMVISKARIRAQKD